MDDRHIKNADKTFAKLNFSTFCAGELELIRRPKISPEEQRARIDILLTLCYHHSYVGIDELKTQYGATMQRVERGAAQWSESLAERLHHDLAFRASVAIRSDRNIQASSEKGGGSTDNKQQVKKDSKIPSEIKLHYCLDYNKGSCSHNDNHEGKFRGQDVTFWHICRRCLFSDDKLKRCHPETDATCPSKSS